MIVFAFLGLWILLWEVAVISSPEEDPLEKGKDGSVFATVTTFAVYLIYIGLR